MVSCATKGEIWLENFENKYEESKLFSFDSRFNLYIHSTHAAKENFSISIEHSFIDDDSPSETIEKNITHKTYLSTSYPNFQYYYFPNLFTVKPNQNISIMPGYRIKWKIHNDDIQSKQGYFSNSYNEQFKW